MWELESTRGFLDRNREAFDGSVIQPAVAGKRVLITGAAGFIGSGLARALSQFAVEHLFLLDIAESGLQELSLDLDRNFALSHEEIVADVCDAALLGNIFDQYDPQIVLHAAACKHVPLMEKNPFAAAKTNVLGTLQVAHTAAAYGAKDLILVSTDKAVAPASIMGATKRIAELIMLVNRGRTRMKAVRLGNVWGSTGSIVPLLLRQIAQGGPITITDAACTRHFLSIEDVVQRLLCSLLFNDSSAIYVSETGRPRRIIELAEFLLERADLNREDIEWRFIGLRAGEKLREQMTSDDERVAASSMYGLHKVLRSPMPSPEVLSAGIREIEAAVRGRDLSSLLQAITGIVPAYAPSAYLRSQAGDPAAAASIA